MMNRLFIVLLAACLGAALHRVMVALRRFNSLGFWLEAVEILILIGAMVLLWVTRNG